MDGYFSVVPTVSTPIPTMSTFSDVCWLEQRLRIVARSYYRCIIPWFEKKIHWKEWFNKWYHELSKSNLILFLVPRMLTTHLYPHSHLLSGFWVSSRLSGLSCVILEVVILPVMVWKITPTGTEMKMCHQHGRPPARPAMNQWIGETHHCH